MNAKILLAMAPNDRRDWLTKFLEEENGMEITRQETSGMHSPNCVSSETGISFWWTKRFQEAHGTLDVCSMRRSLFARTGTD